jgi:hypothetical protein
VIPKAARVFVPSAGIAAGHAASDGLSGLEGMVNLGLLSAGGFVSCFRFLSVFF